MGAAWEELTIKASMRANMVRGSRMRDWRGYGAAAQAQAQGVSLSANGS